MSISFAFASKPALLVAASGVAVVAVAVVGWRVATNPPALGSWPAAPAASTSSAIPNPPAQTTAAAPLAPSVAVASAPPSVPPMPPAAVPGFDVVRVEPTGEAVVAGRAAPGARVRLVDQGRTLAEATADSAGQFVLMPSLAPGDHELTLAVDGSDKGSTQSVTVVVAPKRDSAPLVALAAPGQATKVLSGIEAPKASPAPQVFIKTVEATPEGRLLVSGTGTAGANLRLYLEDAPLAQAAADKSGAWSLDIEKPLTPRSYRVRADEIGRDGTVEARSEVTFDWAGAPARVAAGTAEPAAKEATVKVARGDSLWRISRTMFGAGRLYTQIYDANAKQIRDRSKIYPGQVFVVPKS